MTTPVAANGDPVGAMLDKSGNGHHLTQSVAGNRMVYKTSGGLHWVEATSAGRRLNATFALSQPWDRLSAVYLIDNGNRILANGSTAGAALLFQPVDGQIALYDGSQACTMSVSIATDIVATERHNGASSRLAIDNGSYTTGDPGATAADGLTIAAQSDGNFSTQMRCYGLVQVGRALTDTEIAKLRTYLAAKQGRVL